MRNYLFNPFYALSISFIFGIMAFALKWSEAYQEISYVTLSIIFSIIIMFFIFGIAIQKSIVVDIKSLSNISEVWFYLFIGGMVLDIIYSGTIPLYNMVSGNGLFYKDISHIPYGLYVLIRALGSYLSIFYFSKYLQENNRRYLILCFICFVFICLGVNRSILVIVFLSCVLIFLSQVKGINTKKVFKILLILVISTSLFAKVGELRSNNYKNENYLSKHSLEYEDLILHKGQATIEFKNSYIPNSLFWLYAYLGSPIANLDSILEHPEKSPPLMEGLGRSILPDFIKSLLDLNEEKDKSSFKLDVFNAYSLWGLPAQLYGFKGIFLTFMCVVLGIVILFIFMQKTNNKIIPYSVISTASFLSVFANMYQSDIVFFSVLFSLLFNLRLNVNDKSQTLKPLPSSKKHII
jgi:hypothetical protein